jgi:hypothetical protein
MGWPMDWLYAAVREWLMRAREVCHALTAHERLAIITLILAVAVQLIAIFRGVLLTSVVGGAMDGWLMWWLIQSIRGRRGSGL